jgi:hypothetical protein
MRFKNFWLRMGDFLTLGWGIESCASWLARPPADGTGDQWILGLWSGLNEMSSSSVGSSADGHGVVEEVRRFCEEHPSTNLTSTASTVYMNIRQKGL